MQVNKLALAAEKCKKPCSLLNFTQNCCGQSEKAKVRYKHIEQMSDEAIALRSIIKAHQDAQKSKKMALYKAIPLIATGLTGISLALTRPGKLSEKAVTGLGFLATVAGINAVGDIAFSNDKDKRKNAYATLGTLVALGAGAFAMSKDVKGTSKIKNFITKEATQLTNEINKTKIAELSNKYVEPFIAKHPKFACVAPFLTAVSTCVLGSFASLGLIKGISKDIKQNACDNFERAKFIQQIARNDFDRIDAIEV